MLFPSAGFTPPLQDKFPLQVPARKVSSILQAASHMIGASCSSGCFVSYTLLSFLCFPSASLHVRAVRTVGKGPSSSAGGPVNGTVVRSAEEKTAEYAVFALVPIFCVMGLLGILICNILKKKGYRCSADKEGGDEETATPQKEGELTD